jgi:hypothetical protein
MSNKGRFKTWNILDCGLARSSTGFNYWEAKALADELIRREETPRIFSHRIFPSAAQFPGVLVIPTFSVSLYADVSNDPARSAVENFVAHNRHFYSDLARLDPASFRDSLALFPMITERQLVGLFHWLRSLPPQMKPKAAINLFEPMGEWTETNPSVRVYRTAWSKCPPDVKSEVAIFSRTPRSAAKFTTELGIPAAVFPHVLPEHLLSPKESTLRTAQDPMIVSFVGGARRERGCALVADVVKQCGGMGVQFVVQVRSGLDAGFDAKEMTALSVLPHVRILQGPLGRDEYYSTIRDSIVLLPYKPDQYRWRASGVYNEAKLLDAPILVTAGTWMADEVRSSGNGLIIEDFSAAAVVKCIAQAQRELPLLKAAAVRVGKEARKKDGVARCIQTVETAFSR